MVFATKMSTCPKVPGRALLVREHAIAQEAEAEGLALARPAFVDKRHGLVNEVVFEVLFADIRSDVPCLAVQREPVNSDAVVRHPLDFDLGGVDIVTAHPASRYRVCRWHLD